jgi:hypothetical protein
MKYMTHRTRKKIENAKKNKPWEYSTGPNTDEGKAISSQNAMKHGMRTAMMIDLYKTMADQNRYLREVMVGNRLRF